MIVTIMEEDKVFEPITITLTIESEEELCDLFLRTSVNPDAVNHEVGGLKYKANTYGCQYLFTKLKQEVRKLNQQLN